MIDTGNSINVVYKRCYDYIWLGTEQLRPSLEPFYGFTRNDIIPTGQVKLPLMLGDSGRQTTVLVDFLS